MTQPQATSPLKPAPELVIDDIDTLRVLADPLRVRILELVAEPASAKEIAAQLGIAQTKLYYHLNQLEERGLIRVVQTRLVSGIVEKRYQVSAYSFRVDRALLAVGSAADNPGNLLLASALDSLQADWQRSFEAGLIDTSPAAPLAARFMLSRSLVSMTPEQAEHFYQRMEALLEEIKTLESDAQDAQSYTFALFWFPAQHKSATPASSPPPGE
ncbi:MAG TPA: helix-turn-helix domain-containing protein [Caldilineaceae bacterium]|nr:helix-turn-helix domain-containing protein [Caldilineaceae bacterium]